MKYLIINATEEEIREFSEELYKISRPESVRDPEDVTTMLYGWIQHPETGEFALTIPDDGEYELPVSEQRNVGRLISLYARFFARQNKMNRIVQNIINGRIKTKNLLPIDDGEDALDEQTMRDNGWFQDGLI